jgi:hypothetical protein
VAARASTAGYHEDCNISFWDEFRDENCSQKGALRRLFTPLGGRAYTVAF